MTKPGRYHGRASSRSDPDGGVAADDGDRAGRGLRTGGPGPAPGMVGVRSMVGETWHTSKMFHQPMSDDVLDVLAESQRFGFLGGRPIDEVVDHARGFVDALDGVDGTVVDLGAGGGVPGFVIAHDRPDLRLTMVDRRAKRTDFLRRMIRRLRWSDRVEAVADDVAAVIVRSPAVFDAAVARGFGPPDVTLSFASQLVRAGGRIVISEPPSGDRWSPDLLADLGVRRVDVVAPQVIVFERDGFT